LYNHVRLTEQWESEEALHEHIRSDLYRHLLAAMELSKQPPEVMFHYFSETKGFELVEELRGQNQTSCLAIGIQTERKP